MEVCRKTPGGAIELETTLKGLVQKQRLRGCVPVTVKARVPLLPCLVWLICRRNRSRVGGTSYRTVAERLLTLTFTLKAGA